MIEKNEPLVSIGVPTYNRPGGLRKTLEALLNQSYLNIEIIVSDNASPGNEVIQIKEEFLALDPRVKFFIQDENKGAVFNFYFVLKQARGGYFMWTADDDEWQGKDFLQTLMQYAPAHILTFPSAEVVENDKTTYPLSSYQNCISPFDYSKNFCCHGWGYPFYGIYNLKKFYDSGMKFEFDQDLAYYTEGTFLHKIFLAGPCKYVPEAQIRYAAYGSFPTIEVCIDSWMQYFKRTLMIYHHADLPEEKKMILIDIILKDYTFYARNLYEKLIHYKKPTENFKTIPLKKSSIFDKLLRRLKRTINVLITGNCK